MNKEFYILEARHPVRGVLIKRKIYTTEKQYLSEGINQVTKLSKHYNIKVTKYICTDSVEVLNKEKL